MLILCCLALNRICLLYRADLLRKPTRIWNLSLRLVLRERRLLLPTQRYLQSHWLANQFGWLWFRRWSLGFFLIDMILVISKMAICFGVFFSSCEVEFWNCEASAETHLHVVNYVSHCNLMEGWWLASGKLRSEPLFLKWCGQHGATSANTQFNICGAHLCLVQLIHS